MKKLISIIAFLISLTLSFYPALSQEDIQTYLQKAREYQTQGKIDEAIETLNKALEIKPDLKEAYFILGNIYIQNKNYEKAKEIFSKLNQIAPEDRKSYYLSGAASYLLGDYNNAIKNIETIIQKNPTDIISLNYLALILYKNGSSEKALDLIIKATKYNLKGEGDFSIYAELATLSFDVNKITPSLKDIREICENNPKNSYSYTILGWFDYNENNLEDSCKNFKKAIELKQSDVINHYLLGLVFYMTNEPIKSIKEYEEALKIDRELVKSVNEKFQYIERARQDKDIVELEKKLEDNPENTDLMYRLSRYYNDRGSYNQSEELIQKAIELKPEGKYYKFLGEIYSIKNEWKKAIEALNKVSSEEDRDEKYWTTLCHCYERNGNYELAIKSGEKAIKIAPKNKTVITSMAISYYYQQDYTNSVITFKKVIEEEQQNGDVLCRFALALQAEGNMKEAIENYKKAINVYPTLLDSYSYLGSCLMIIGDYKESVKYLEKAVSMKVNYQSIYTPDFNRIRLNLATAFLELKDYEKAIEQLDIVIKEDPLSPRAYLIKAYINEETNKKEDADSDYKRVYSLLAVKAYDSNDELFRPYSENPEFIPITSPIISYSIPKSERWAEVYHGEPQFVLKKPEKSEKDIKKSAGYNYDDKIKLIKLYLYERKPQEALKELKNIPKNLISVTELYNIRGIIYTYEKKNDLALKELKKALELSPNSYEINNNIGAVYIIQKNYLMAKKHLKKSISLCFFNTWAYNNLGIIFSIMEDYKSAEEVFYFSKVSDLKSPWARHNLGWTYFKENKYKEAIKEMEGAIKLAPKEALFLSHTGWIYHEQGDIKQAITYYKKSLQINPSQANIYNTIGTAFAETKKYDEAIEYYKKAVKMKFDEEKYHRNLGIAYYRLDRYKESQEQFKEGLKLNPYSVENLLSISASLCKQNKLEEASEYINKASYYNENYYDPVNDIVLTNNQGAMYLEQNKLELAEKQFEIILNYKETYEGLEKYLSEYYIDSYNNLGILKYKQGLIDEAMERLEQSDKLMPYNPDTLMSMASVIQNKDINEAKKLYEKVIKIVPVKTIAYNNLGYLYFKEGNFNKAIEIMEIARKKGTEPLLNYNLGGLYFTMGNDDKALQYLKNINEESNLYSYANYLIGLIYYKQGKEILADERYKKAVEEKNVSSELVEEGWSFLGLKAYRLAGEKFNKAIDFNKENIDAYVGIGNYYFNTGDIEKAKREIDKAIKISPSYAKAYIINALLYYYDGNFEKAQENLKKATELEKSNNLAWYNYGYILQEHGDIEKAKEAYKEVIKIDKKSDMALCAEGFTYFFEGNYEEARKKAYQIIQSQPDFADAYFLLGKIAEKEDNKNLAIDEYKRTLRADPFHMDAKKSLEKLMKEVIPGGN